MYEFGHYFVCDPYTEIIKSLLNTMMEFDSFYFF